MSKHALSVLVTLFFSIYSFTQNVFTKVYGGINYDKAYTVGETLDGGFFVSGITGSYSFGNNDIHLVRCDSLGDTLWTRNYGSAVNDLAVTTVETPDSGFAIGIYNNIYLGKLIKVDKNGNMLWANSYLFLFSDFTVCSDGGYVMCGANPAQDSIVVMRVQPGGQTNWSKTYAVNNYLRSTGTAIKELSSGGYMVMCDVQDSSSRNILMMQLDTSGTVSQADLVTGGFNLNAFRLSEERNGVFTLMGAVTPSANSEVVVIKISTSGNIIFSKRYSAMSGFITGYDMFTDPEGETFLAGFKLNSTVFTGCMLRLDTAGVPVTSRLYATNMLLLGIAPTHNGGLFLTGGYPGIHSANDALSMIVMRTDGLGLGCGGTPVGWNYATHNITVSQVTISVGNGVAVQAATVFSGSGSVPVTLCGVGAAEIPPAPSVSVFPNPSAGYVYIQAFGLSGAVTIQVTDFTGKVVRREERNLAGESQIELDLSVLSNGVYLVQIESENGWIGKEVVIYK
jgi:hypothetical protein